MRGRAAFGPLFELFLAAILVALGLSAKALANLPQRERSPSYVDMMQAIESWQSKQLGAKPETNTNGSIELAALMQKLRKSASEGDAKAQWELAKMYHAGSGVAKDPAEEFHWCLESAKQGLAVAQCSLAVFYQFGQGTTNNNDLALEWYRKASGQSFAPAQCNLGMLYDQGLGVTMDHA